VPFKTAPCSFFFHSFFFEEKKNKIWEWSKIELWQLMSHIHD
jgi:hypothetical protein